MSKTVLIQLVSEQTLPNILAAFALEPAKIVLLHSPRTRSHVDKILAALQVAGQQFELHVETLTDTPSIQETGTLVKQIAEAAATVGYSPVINFTGGTKLMSIGAFVAAYSGKFPSFYVDTAGLAIRDGETGDLPHVFPRVHTSLERAQKRLNLDIIAAAHGIEEITSLDPDPLLPLASHLLENHIGRRFLPKTFIEMLDSNPIRPCEVAEFLHCPVKIPLETARFALDAQLLEERKGELYFARPESLSELEKFLQEEEKEQKYDHKKWFAALAPLQTAINFFGGGWWELVVYDAARRSGVFRDIRWSATIRIAGQTYEKDIIALQDLSLAIFSCKRGGGKKERLIGAMDELDANARQIGGSLTRRYFCLAATLREEVFSPLRARAKQTNITLVGPAEQLNPSIFRPDESTL